MKRGYCSHPHKKTRIVTEWKCVDINYLKPEYPEACRKKVDWYGVCEMCKYFTADAEQPVQQQPAVQPEKSASTESKPAETNAEPDPAWDAFLEDLV